MIKSFFAPLAAAAAIVALAMASAPAQAQNVKITGLGALDGDFCNRDRGLLLKDPNGTVILYDAGRTGLDHPLLAGGEIGEFIDVVLLTSMHSDHLGTQKINVGAPGPCSGNALITIAPDTNTTDIAGAKGSKIFVGGEMRGFLRSKMVAAGGATNQVDVLRPGGERVFNNVKFAVVMAIHSNGIPRNALSDATLATNLTADGLTAYAGPDNGYIIQFTNGLVVYLTGDTGQTSDMLHIAGKDGYYGANLAVVSMGGVFAMGPEEAAWAVDTLIKPKSVILTHSNEDSTDGTGSNTVRAGSKMETFMNLSHTQAHIPSTGRTMEFNGLGRCVAGACQPHN